MDTRGFSVPNSSLFSTTPLRSQEKKAEQVKTQNAMVFSDSGQGSSCDKSARLVAAIAPITNTTQLQYIVDALYYGDWQAQKIVDIPVDDMLREPIEYDGLTEEQEQDVFRYQNALNFEDTLQKALRMERLYGGAVIFMGLKDAVDDPSKPVDFSNISFGDLDFLNAIPRTRITKSIIQNNATLPDYGKPLSYIIKGQEIHKDRLLIFNGNPLDAALNSGHAGMNTSLVNVFQLRDGFGMPILLRLYNDLTWATGSRQSAYHLIQKASVTVLKGDLQSASVYKSSESRPQELAQMANEMDIYNATLIQSSQGNEASVDTLAANFGSVPELMMFYLQTLSAASDIPATRFLGQAPGGLNATGEGDLENYYNMIGAKQRNTLEPKIKDFLKILLPSVGIEIDVADVGVRFKELWNVSEEEQARVRQIDTQDIVALEAAGIISQEQAAAETKQRDVLLTDFEDFPPPEIQPKFDESDIDLAPDVKSSIDKISGLGGE